MTYQVAKQAALQCSNYNDVDRLLKAMEDNDAITDTQYYNLKHIAINAAYKAMETR